MPEEEVDWDDDTIDADEWRRGAGEVTREVDDDVISLGGDVQNESMVVDEEPATREKVSSDTLDVVGDSAPATTSKEPSPQPSTAEENPKQRLHGLPERPKESEVVQDRPKLDQRQSSRNGSKAETPPRRDREQDRQEKSRQDRSRAKERTEERLPPGWQETQSKTHDRPFWYHAETGKTSWTRPTGPPDDSKDAPKDEKDKAPEDKPKEREEKGGAPAQTDTGNTNVANAYAARRQRTGGQGRDEDRRRPRSPSPRRHDESNKRTRVDEGRSPRADRRARSPPPHMRSPVSRPRSPPRQDPRDSRNARDRRDPAAGPNSAPITNSRWPAPSSSASSVPTTEAATPASAPNPPPSAVVNAPSAPAQANGRGTTVTAAKATLDEIIKKRAALSIKRKGVEDELAKIKTEEELVAKQETEARKMLDELERSARSSDRKRGDDRGGRRDPRDGRPRDSRDPRDARDGRDRDQRDRRDPPRRDGPRSPLRRPLPSGDAYRPDDRINRERDRAPQPLSARIGRAPDRADSYHPDRDGPLANRMGRQDPRDDRRRR